MARKGRASMIATLVAIMALVVATAATGAAVGRGGIAAIFEKDDHDDLDARRGRVEPTDEQRRAVANLGARATWNEFGTAHSLIKDGGYLASGIQADTPEDAARRWIDTNRVLFRLESADDLALVNDAVLTDTDGHAVVFGQEFDGVPAAEGGLLVVGVEGSEQSEWRVAHVSSTVTGDSTLSGGFSLSEAAAFRRAAADIGLDVAPDAIGTPKKDREWSVFSVVGFKHPQRARKVAVPTPLNGVRAGWEILLVQDHDVAYHHFIDADSGAVLVRKHIAHNEHPPGDFFSGVMPAEDGACAEDNGPWTVSEGESVETISVSAEAVLTTNDIVLHLVRDGEIVATQDTLFSPETLVYEPPDDGAGTYHVRVCDFVDGAVWIDPRDYIGQIVFSPAGPGTAFPYPPKWKVFPAYPELGNQTYPWNYPADDSREVWCWESSVGTPPIELEECDREVQNLASRAPWDFDVRLNSPTFTTRGNNAVSAESWTSPLTPGPFGFRPVSPSRDYNYPWTIEWHENECLSPFLIGQSNDISAAVANLFAMHNRMHDWAYFLGFTERHWNAQDVNFGTGGTAERDPLLGDAQAGAVTGGAPSYLGRDNANMIPLPDGVPPITNMHLWQPIAGALYAPCVDGDYDMAVIAHEYGHLIESRMIGKGGTRSGHHAGAMGESVADLMAAEYLNAYGFAPVADENPFGVGAYVTANKRRAIRNYGMNFPRTGAFPEPGVSPEVNPLNFSNIGYDIVGQQVHANGEIWSATNFDIRQALVEKYNSQFPASDWQLQEECADGKVPANRCPGNRRWIQLMHDSFLLMPTNPSMLQARDAILAADQMRFGGANQDELWFAFAQRGMGEFASSTNSSPEGAPSSDTDPTPSFESPNHDAATVTFTTRNEDGDEVPARIYVGHYEARVSPIADTDPATGPADGSGAPDDSNLDDTAAFVEGTYEFAVQANGYGLHRFSVDLAAGETREIALELETNWASVHNGATASGDGQNHNDLIDDTEGTSWDLTGAVPDVRGKQVTVELAGDDPVDVAKVNVSAMLFGQNRFTALRQFEIQTCVATELNLGCTAPGSFTAAHTSAEDAFPGFNPRPVAPEMLLRTFELDGPVSTTHLRIVVLNNQCTGDEDFQGDQNQDPISPSDCGATLPPFVADRRGEVHIAELQAFSPRAPVTPEADIAVDKSDSQDPVRQGQLFDYIIEVANNGPAAAEGVTLLDRLPRAAGFESVTTTQGSCTHRQSRREVTCDLGDLAAGATATVTITMRAQQRSTIENYVQARAAAPEDPNPANNSDTETTTIIRS